MSDLGTDAQEAITSVKLANMRKRLNAEGWSDNMENLMKNWGEKAAGLRFMHATAGGSWKKFSNQLSIAGIIVTSFASTISLVATSIDDDETKTSVMYGVGAIGLVSTLIQSLKKFYNSEEKAADHISVSKQFGSYYRYMTLQLGMSREDRDPADVLSAWALKEYERLQQESPGLGGTTVELFKKKFKNSEQSFPDIAEDEYIISVYTSQPMVEHVKPPIEIPLENIQLHSSSLNKTDIKDVEEIEQKEEVFVEATLPDDDKKVVETV